MDKFDSAALAYAPAPLLSSEHDQYEKTRRVFEKVPTLHEFSEFAFAIGDLMGWTLSRDPLLEQVNAMLADVQALASSARDTIRSIVLNNEDLQAPLTVAQLALADRDSKVAVNTFTGAAESGYWLRPYSGPAVGLDTWGTKLDDRAAAYDDGTVWDPRIVMPTLLYALTVRVIVLKALYSSSRKYCHEIKERVAFLLQVQMHWQTEIRRKLHLSGPEMKIGAGFSVRPFAAGAVACSRAPTISSMWMPARSICFTPVASGVVRFRQASLPSRRNWSLPTSHTVISTCDSRPSIARSSRSRQQSRSRGCAGRRGCRPFQTRSMEPREDLRRASGKPDGHRLPRFLAAGSRCERRHQACRRGGRRVGASRAGASARPSHARGRRACGGPSHG